MVTRLAASPGGTLYSPNPSRSINTPLFRVSRGESLMTKTLPTGAGECRTAVAAAAPVMLPRSRSSQSVEPDEPAGAGLVQDQVGGQSCRQRAPEPVDFGSTRHHADAAPDLAELGQVRAGGPCVERDAVRGPVGAEEHRGNIAHHIGVRQDVQVVFIEVAAGVNVAGVVGVDRSDTKDRDAHPGLQLQDPLNTPLIPHGPF